MRVSFLTPIGAALCAAGLSGPVSAQEPASPPAPQSYAAQDGRFSMTPTQGGFLRLDKETGAVSFCTVDGGLSLCRISADERAAFESEILRLRRENAELKAGQARAGGLPGEEEFERAMSFTERFLRRMMRVFKDETNGDKS